jgi:predicted nucleic acid-binding protein
LVVRFVDTNVFIRVITLDDPVRAEKCIRFFERLEEGLEEATTSESVVAEVVYVLTSPKWYRVPRRQIAGLVVPFLIPTGMRLPSRALFIRALRLFSENKIDIEDALSIAHMEHAGLETMVSYDRDFDAIPGIVRVEP